VSFSRAAARKSLKATAVICVGDWVRHVDIKRPMYVINICGDKAECRWKTFGTWRRVWLKLADLTTKLF
jgi:transposase